VENMVGAHCPACSRTGTGTVHGRVDPESPTGRSGDFFGRIYPDSKWRRHPRCVNCKTGMVKLFDVTLRRD
jgi:hypothetical protein